MSDIDTNEIIEEVKALRDLNNKRANVSLVGLLIVFFLSLSFFLFSDYLSPAEAQTLDKDIYLYERELKNQLTDLNLKYGEVKSDLSIYKKDALTENDQIRRSKISPEEVLFQRADSLDKQQSSILKELNALQEIRLAGLKASNVSKSIESIISTSITRVGAVLLSVFMMQILFRLLSLLYSPVESLCYENSRV